MYTEQSQAELAALLDSALQKRVPLIEPSHTQALRLFNGYAEGASDLIVDLFGRTLLLYSHHTDVIGALNALRDVRSFYLERLPWLTCVIEKHRNAADEEKPKGIIIHGSKPDMQITENGIHYALNLQLNKDASFYPDTRALRQWITAHSAGKTVLNTFAYTGSLGIAALSGGAERVLQVDLNRNYLGLAHKSRALNAFDASKMKLMPVDFFMAVGSLKRQKELFDIVILDPPFFSTTQRGRVNQAGECTRILNKVRPLAADAGTIAVVNNALFYSGQAFMAELEALCAGGYLSIAEIIPIPEDVTGFTNVPSATLPADPTPFNHPTKIVLLKVKRK
jgi:23S rRNA (cytosine1962-C5)-methyltransferase